MFMLCVSLSSAGLVLVTVVCVCVEAWHVMYLGCGFVLP